MIFDRSRYYWIALGVVVLVVAGAYFLFPRISPEQRVHEQLAALASEPWVRVRVDDVRYAGAGEPEEALLRGIRLDTGAPVAIDFTVSSPYTASGAMQQVLDFALPGSVADVVLIPRSLVLQPYRSRLQPAATHVGVALFVALPDQPATAAAAHPAMGQAAPDSARAAAPDSSASAPAETPDDAAPVDG